MTKLLSLSLLALAASTAACSFYARSPEDYRDATQAMLNTRSDAMKACYDAALKTTPNAAGTVAVHFTVEHETGKVMNPTVDKTKSTAPDAVQSCVTTNLSGLVLNPPDKRDGDATFVWDFEPGAAPPAPTPAPMPVGTPSQHS